MTMRVGYGFDAHALAEGRKLVLAGVDVAFSKGLLGFSDGDVAAHALIDALYGAAALGDCGTHFPAGDPQYADAHSIGLLAQAAGEVRAGGWRIVNVDCTIVAEQPALLPFIEQMRRSVADALDVEMSAVNVKAKRTEGLGYTGEGRGMAAHAVALLERA